MSHYTRRSFIKSSTLAAGSFALLGCSRSSNHQRSICNPLNISYRFALEGFRAESGFREGADPAIVYYQGRFWLFASKSGGYWHSRDLADWTFVSTKILETERYAPDAAVIEGRLVTTGTNMRGDVPVYATTDPLTDSWSKLSEVPSHADVHYFQDDDGRVYRYDGLSNKAPLYGCEVDPRTLLPLTERTALYAQDQERHGWELRGENHEGDGPAHIEGCWMTKLRGAYYLQYSAPGTEYNIYSDSALIGAHPLGPFQLQPHNPFSYKPTGFITGAGHGSTFQDAHGNWWHASTMRISVRHKFERRIGLWPAGFDEDGVLFCNTSFGDWPMRLPQGRWNPWEDAFTGWMLLSYQAECTASSSLPDYPAKNAVDENIRSWWCAQEAVAAWLQLDIGNVAEVRAIQINFAEHNARVFGRPHNAVYHAYLVEASENGREWRTLVDKSANREDVPHDYIELDGPAQARFLKLTILHVPGGLPAVAGFRIFGQAPGSPPLVPELTRVERGQDRRTLSLDWKAQEDAIGYNVWWGVSPDKLYSNCLVYSQDSIDLRCLDSRLEYHVALEAFNSNGRSSIGKLHKI